jgi:hypothetical protein
VQGYEEKDGGRQHCPNLFSDFREYFAHDV